MADFSGVNWYHRVSAGLVDGFQIINRWGRHNNLSNIFTPMISDSLGGDFWRPSIASTVRIKAGGDANDAAAGSGARKIIVFGLDENYTFASESIITAGVSASASTTTTFIRITRAEVTEVGVKGGTNASEIMVENTNSTQDIIPINPIDEGQGRSGHCQFSSPINTNVYLMKVSYNVDSNNSSDIHVMVTDHISNLVPPFSPTRNLVQFDSVVDSLDLTVAAPVLLNANSNPIDVWISAKLSGNPSTLASAGMQLLLQEVTP